MELLLGRKIPIIVSCMVLTISCSRIAGHGIKINTKAITDQNTTNSTIKEKQQIHRILFLGSRPTLGISIEATDSFPAKLQKLIEQKTTHKALVFNKGLTAATTGFILKKLQANIDEIHPTSIVVMAGYSNEWSNYGYNTYLNRIKDRASLSGSPIATKEGDADFDLPLNPISMIKYQVYGCKDASFAGSDPNGEILSRIEASFRDKTKEKEIVLAAYFAFYANNNKSALEHIQRALSIAPKIYSFEADMLVSYLQKEETENLNWKHLRTISKNGFPGNEVILNMRNFLCKVKYPFESTNSSNVKKNIALLQLGRKFSLTSHDFSLALAMNAAFNGNRLETVFYIREGLLNYTSDTRSLPSYLMQFMTKEEITSLVNEKYKTQKTLASFPVLSKEELQSWIESDLTEILHLAQKNNIPIVFQTFPPPQRQKEPFANTVIRNFALKNSANFSDTFQNLNSYFLLHGQKKDHYSALMGQGDWHLNAKGDSLLAELLFEDLKKLHIID